MSEQKVRNTFGRIYAELERFHKVVRKGGLLEKNIMDIGGDPTYLQDMREHIDFLMNSLEDAEQGALGHIVESHASNKNVVTEGVLDGDDEDGFMARSQLYFLARDAIQLHGMIDDRDNLEPWVQSKIAQSAQSIEAVRRYTEYNTFEDEVDGIPGEVDEGFSILPNIDRERYQERDGLEGPYRTKSGKVVYYDPQEGAYYDPDTDFYLTYDEWKALDEGEMPLPKSKPKRIGSDPQTGATRGIDPADNYSPEDLKRLSKQPTRKESVDEGGKRNKYKIHAVNMKESEERPYVCVHAKKGKYECSAESSYAAAKKAAKHWKLKSTSGIDAHLADKEHTAEGFASDAQRKAAFANGYDPDKKKKKNEATELVAKLKERAINELNLDPIAMKKQTQKALAGESILECLSEDQLNEVYAQLNKDSGKKLDEALPALAVLAIQGASALGRYLGPKLAKAILSKGGAKVATQAIKNPKAVASWAMKNPTSALKVGANAGVRADVAQAGTRHGIDVATGASAGRRLDRAKSAMDANAQRKDAYDAEMKKLRGESAGMVKDLRKSLEERMIGELDVEFDDKQASNVKAKNYVNSQSTSGTDGKNRTKQIGSTFTQTQGNKEVGFDKFNADSKIGGVKQRNSVKGIHQQQGDEFSGSVYSTDSAAQGIDKDKFKTDAGYDRAGLNNARKAEFDKTTTKQKLKYSDKDSYQSGLGIEKDVADLKNMFNN